MIIHRTTLLALLFTLAAHFVQAANTIEVKRWDVIDIPFYTHTQPDAPFERDFTATFTGPDDESLEIPAFYNGDKQWIIRFSAPTASNWKYLTHSSAKEFDQLHGELKVSKNTNRNLHGGIVTRKDNAQHFFYEDGTRYMQLPFECDWLFALDYDNLEATPKTDYLLDLLTKEGINQIVTTVYSYDVTWEKDTMLFYVLKENYQLSLYWQHPVAQPGGTLQWFNTLTGEYSAPIPSTSKYFFPSPFRGEADSILIRRYE